MERAEFDEIIKPLASLPKENRDFLINSLVGNFNNWMSKQLMSQSVAAYQKCPKCDGQGSVSKPPGVPGDVHHWVSSSSTFLCDVCNGAKIFPTPVIQRQQAQLDISILDQVDEVLASLEDHLHGIDGDNVTRARGLLINFQDSLK